MQCALWSTIRHITYCRACTTHCTNFFCDLRFIFLQTPIWNTRKHQWHWMKARLKAPPWHQRYMIEGVVMSSLSFPIFLAVHARMVPPVFRLGWELSRYECQHRCQHICNIRRMTSTSKQYLMCLMRLADTIHDAEFTTPPMKYVIPIV